MNCKNIFIYLSILIIFISGARKSSAQCYELVWSDEFNYTGYPDPAVWNMEIGNNNGSNNESQYYTKNDKDNCWVENGSLVITALKESFGGQLYTSARINTKGLKEFKYGKVEARLKLPYGQGIWPAFWMLGSNIDQVSWPACGEIDIMELIGGAGSRDRTFYGTPHWADANGNHAQYNDGYKNNNNSLPSGRFADDYHIFSIEWTTTKIAWFLDGIQIKVMSTTPAALSEFQQKYFIILNLAVGGSWPGYPDGTTVFPQKFEVDYVRVYQMLSKELIQGRDSVVAKQKGQTYSLSAVEGRQFLWTVPEGTNLLSRNDSSTVAVDWGCTPGTISCKVTTPCATTYNFSKSVKVGSISIDGPLFYDKPAGNLIFTAPLMTETNYYWSGTAGAFFISGDTSNSAEVVWGTGEGSISLMIVNSCNTFNISKKVFKYGQYPYPDPESPFIIPGTINSTNFDYGGEGVAYHDVEVVNQGPGPRKDERVDTENQTLFPNVGWIITGEWLEYTIKVPQAGYYKIEMKVASANTSNIGPIRILINGESRIADIAVPPTGAWATFVKVSQRLLYLNTSDTVLRIEAVKGGFNLGPITFTVDNTVSVTSLKAGKGKIEMFPNPVNDLLNINLSLTKPGEVKVSVMDISGKEVFSSVHKDLQTSVQRIVISEQIRALKSGIYFIEINSSDQKYFSKFLKN
jgi:beta-glucanase (GH16 family)